MSGARPPVPVWGRRSAYYPRHDCAPGRQRNRSSPTYAASILGTNNSGPLGRARTGEKLPRGFERFSLFIRLGEGRVFPKSGR